MWALYDLPSAQPTYTDAEIQKMQDIEQAQIEKAFELGREDAKAEASQRWIPCSKTPETDRNVFVARGTGDMMTVCVGHYDHDCRQWYEDRNWFAKCLYDGVYWCEMPPLPEPYQEEGE